MKKEQYCNSLTQYNRFKTREVTVGNLKIGGENPIVVQSMTTTNTMDTEATVAQSIRMIDAGCQLVRITAPSKREAENLRNIKEELVKLLIVVFLKKSEKLIKLAGRKFIFEYLF